MKGNRRWSKLGRWASAGILSLTTLLGHVYPVHAETPVAAPALSPWSVATLNEGEKYGIFPLNWYQDGKLQEPIPSEKFRELMTGTAKKLDLLGFKKKEPTLSFGTDKGITREIVLTSLYTLLSNYEWPKSFEISADAPIDYMKKNGLVTGTDAGLGLNQPATVEQALVLASRVIAFAYDKAGGGSEGFMWKVTKGDNTLYLLGSIHMGITDMYPMKKRITEAFEASDDLWVEVDIVNGDVQYLTQKMVYRDGTTLKDHVSAETYEELQKVLAKLGLPEDSLDALKPFAVALSLPSYGYYDNQEESQIGLVTGIDSYFITKAMLAGKPIKELEGIKLQADLLADVPAEQQEKELSKLLDDILHADELEKSKTYLKDMQMDWVEGDLEGMTHILTTYGEFSAGEANQRLIGERDKKMASKLVELLEKEGEHTSFVVVGTAHYAMKGMVIDLLKEQGFDVQRMK